jgi:hypothetical protein
MFFNQHFCVAKAADGSDERGCGLLHLGERYLVISQVGIQKTQELTFGHEFYDLVNVGKGK